MPEHVDVIVIGAGHNGLVCAGYLAKAGLDVLVLERSHRIGGACITEELVPGFKFCTFAYSAHGPGPKICRDLEIPADAFTIVPPDAGLLAPYPDGDHMIVHPEPAKAAAEVARLEGGSGERYHEYVDFMGRAIALAEEWFLTPPQTHRQLYERYRGTPKTAVLEALLTRSHWDVLSDYFKSEKVKCALARADDVGYPTAVGSLLAEAVESASTGAGVENKTGLVGGGMGSITRALADACRRFGADIRTNSPVQKILFSNGRATGVQLASGDELTAKLIVSNADPKRTFLTLVPKEALHDDFAHQVRNLKTRAGYMKYHAVLSGVPEFTALPRSLRGNAKAASAVRIAPSLRYFEQAWLDAQSGVPAREPILSLQLPTAYLPDMAPPGKHVFGAWVRFAPARPKEGTWDELRTPVMENITRLIDSYAPGFRDLIEWQRLYTPTDIERETGITDASIRHVDMTLDQMLHRRPMPAWSAYQSPVKGLWLCGSGTHPCGSVTGAPGHNAAQAILGARLPFASSSKSRAATVFSPL
jgi:phytoene dehydrogenase-like protein